MFLEKRNRGLHRAKPVSGCDTLDYKRHKQYIDSNRSVSRKPSRRSTGAWGHMPPVPLEGGAAIGRQCPDAICKPFTDAPVHACKDAPVHGGLRKESGGSRLRPRMHLEHKTLKLYFIYSLTNLPLTDAKATVCMRKVTIKSLLTHLDEDHPAPNAIPNQRAAFLDTKQQLLQQIYLPVCVYTTEPLLKLCLTRILNLSGYRCLVSCISFQELSFETK